MSTTISGASPFTRPAYTPVRQQHLVGYIRRPLARRSAPRPPRADPGAGPVAAPAGLVDVDAAAAITGIPARALTVLARTDPSWVPAARLVGGRVFFDPAQLLAVAS